jgi:hypothetical protein
MRLLEDQGQHVLVLFSLFLSRVRSDPKDSQGARWHIAKMTRTDQKEEEERLSV